MPNQFLSDEFGDIEDYFVTDYWLIDNFVGDSLYGGGVIVTDNWEILVLHKEIFQLPHFPVELIGNRFLVEINIQQQSRPMVVFGLGVVMNTDNLELMSTEVIEILQSPHLPEEQTGNRFLLGGNMRQRLKPMGLCGFGVLILTGNLESIIPTPEAYQSPHLPVETIGNLFLVDFFIRQQSKLMELFGFGVRIWENLELMIL
jgi:hypothetical protein